MKCRFGLRSNYTYTLRNSMPNQNFDIALLTESRYERPRPEERDWYVENILTEDRLVQEALERRGLRVIRLDWATPGFDWSAARLALFRTTWDYFHRFAEFSAWLERVAAQTQLLNPAELIRWNMDKRYLLDLQARGIRIPPTILIPRGAKTSLARLHEQTGWAESVLKPTVSGAARHTYRLSAKQLDAHEARFQELIAAEDMMLQAFQHRIVEQGEIALMVFGGRFSHAILKVAKPGDFRVQDDFGGTVHPYAPGPAEIEFAERVVAACDPLPVYARVDAFYDNDGQLALGELELIEPELWFRFHPPAADLLAAAVAERLEGGLK
jgi:hypothetical protein